MSEFTLAAHIDRQTAWSRETFGPGARTKGVIAHIRKEIEEVAADPDDLSEWIDLIILAIDGATRHGFTGAQIEAGLVAKQAKNEGRTWPDWRLFSEDEAIEHDRSADS